jgi:two-component system NtrC family response regulator
MQQFATQNGRTGVSFSQEAIRALRRHPWPGNVRELQNRVRRAVIMAEGKRLTPGDLELAEIESSLHGSTLKEAREALEREMIQQSLRKHGGKITAAAIELGISRPTFYELMEKLGIQKAEKVT